MILYLHEENPDLRDLKKAAAVLHAGGLVGLPTDSSWSVVCSYLSKDGVAKLRALKAGAEFTPTLLCSQLSQVSDLGVMENTAFRVINKLIPGPYVFILEARPVFEKKTGLKRSELGFRIPDQKIVRDLVEVVGDPLFAVTASGNMKTSGWWDNAFAEEHLFEYGADLEDLPGVELVLDLGEPLPKYLTTVLSFTSGEMEVVRQGVGEV